MKTRQLRNLSFRKIVKHKNLSFRKNVKKNLSIKQTAKRKNKKTRKLQHGGVVGGDDILVITSLSLVAAVIVFCAIMAVISELEYIRKVLIPAMQSGGVEEETNSDVSEPDVSERTDSVQNQPSLPNEIPETMVIAVEDLATNAVAASATGGRYNITSDALDAATGIVEENNSEQVDTTNNDKLDRLLKRLNTHIFYIRLLKWMFSTSFTETMIRQAGRKVLRITGNCNEDIYAKLINDYINNYDKKDTKEQQKTKIQNLNYNLENCIITVDNTTINSLTSSLSNTSSQTELLTRFQAATSTQAVKARGSYFTLPTLPNLSRITKYLPRNYFNRNPLHLLTPKGILKMFRRSREREEAVKEIETVITTENK